MQLIANGAITPGVNATSPAAAAPKREKGTMLRWPRTAARSAPARPPQPRGATSRSVRVSAYFHIAKEPLRTVSSPLQPRSTVPGARTRGESATSPAGAATSTARGPSPATRTGARSARERPRPPGAATLTRAQVISTYSERH